VSRLRAARAWLDAPVSQTERAHYRLGRTVDDDGWRRASRRETLQRSLARRMPSPDKWLYTWGLRRADALPLPALLCIGAQKSATSWLYANLARHPDAFVPPDVKEVHYFDFLFHEPLAAYARVFAAGRDRCRCDVTPNYGRLRPARIRFVRRVMPDARLVFLMRHPVERAWSQAVMDLATRTGRSIEDVSCDEWLAHFRARSNLRNGHYTAMLDAWLRHFPAEQLFVGFYDDVGARPRDLLAKIYRHAGLDPEAEGAYAAANERVAAGPGAPLPPNLRAELEPLFADEVRRIAERYAGTPRSWRG
jgi:hypothetical protein